MENLLKQERACVMIVDHDVDFGARLADWLTAHGYQAVLVRSMETAIEECRELRPQTVFIGLGRSESAPSMDLRGLFRVIEATCPRVSVITMGYRASGKLIEVVTGGAVRHVLVKPIDFIYICRLLQAELNRATASPNVLDTESGPHDRRAIEHLANESAIQGDGDHMNRTIRTSATV